MEKLSIQQEEIIKKGLVLDFRPEIKQWLLDRGYKTKKNSLDEYEYTKGILTIQPNGTFTDGGLRMYIHKSEYVGLDGKCLDTDKYAFNKEFEIALLEIENAQNQANDDIKEFYNRWFLGIVEEE